MNANSDTQSVDPSTSKFHQLLPYAYLTVSPSLSALHATRIKRQHALENPDFCSRCGTFLLDGLSGSRLQRVNKGCNEGKSKRIRTVRCRDCRFANDKEVQKGNAVIYGRRNRRTNRDPVVAVPEPEPVAKAASVVSKIPTPNPSTSARPKLRQKNKSVLQDMLAKSRTREERDKATQSSTGLAAFLSGL